MDYDPDKLPLFVGLSVEQNGESERLSIAENVNSIRDRLQCRTWMRWPACSTDPEPAGPSCCAPQLDPPWSIRIADEAPLCLVAVTHGEAWLLPEDEEALLLGPGDVAVIRGSRHYTVADDPATSPQAIILPGQRCETPDGQEVLADVVHGRPDRGQQPGRLNRDGHRHLRPERVRSAGACSARCRRCSCSPATPGTLRSSSCSRRR